MASKQFKVILQGGGRILLTTPDSLPSAEAGAVMERFEAWLAEGGPVAIITDVDEILDNRPLNEQSLTPFVARDRSSGRYHRRWIEVLADGNERTLTDERCQADQSGRFDVLEEVPASADYDTLCRNCFPPVLRKTDG